MLDKKDLIIFDLDGTLIDSVGIWNETDARLMQELGGPAEDWCVVQKRRDTKLTEYKDEAEPYMAYCRYLGDLCHSSLSAEAIHERRYAIAQDMLETKVDYKPGVPEFLKVLKVAGKTLVIATTTRRNNIDIYRTKNRNIMSKAPLDAYFTKIYAKEDIHHMKPDPEIYLTVLKDFGKRPEECLALEDSLIGVQAAKAAGIETVAVYDKYSESDQEEIKKLADHFVESMEEVFVLEH